MKVINIFFAEYIFHWIFYGIFAYLQVYEFSNLLFVKIEIYNIYILFNVHSYYLIYIQWSIFIEVYSTTLLFVHLYN